MKLDWKRAGRASIAEHNGMTFIAQERCGGLFGWYSLGNSEDLWRNSAADLSGAEADCEAWLEQHDRPEWHDVAGWLSLAEWRGHSIVIHRYEKRGVTRWFLDVSPNSVGDADSRESAKATAEKWVREQTA